MPFWATFRQQWRERWLAVKLTDRWRRWLLIGSGIFAGALVASMLLFGSIARGIVEAKAAERGLVLEIGSLRPGFFKVRLRGLRIRLQGVEGIEARLDVVNVGLGLTLGLDELRASGGVLAIEGDFESVKKQIERFRASRPKQKAGGGRGVPYSIEGLTVLWKAGDTIQRVWGLGYERDELGSESIGFDLARVGAEAVAIEARALGVWFKPSQTGRRIERMSADGLFVRYALDDKEPETSARKGPSDPKNGARGRSSAAPAGTASAAASKKLGQSTVSRAALVRAALRRVAEAGRQFLHPGAKLDLSGVRLRLVHGKQALNIGPSRLGIERRGEQMKLALTPGDSGEAAKNPLRVGLTLPLSARSAELEVSGGPVSLASIGVQEGDFGLTEVSKADIEAKARVALSEDEQTILVEGKGIVSGLSLFQRALAKQPLRGVTVGFSGKAQARLDGSGFKVETARLDVGQVHASASGALELGDTFAVAEVALELAPAPCQALLDSVPDELVPMLNGSRMTGTFSLSAAVRFDTRRLNDMIVDWNLQNQCRITEIPEALSPRRFLRPWAREVFGTDGQPIHIESGAETADWVPYQLISPHMETAVLVSEDGRFFRHQGFDHEAIAKSIRHNVLKGRFARGASTITMQLAKNLYLEREKTLSRKLQEAFLTMLLEQELTKQEIMELYLNVIEYAPGVYGIGPAARYYFNTEPSGLSLAQSLYLASILPNPKRQYFADDGSLSPRWANYLTQLMHVARKIKRITDAELEQGLQERIVLGVPAAELADSEQPELEETRSETEPLEAEPALWP